VRAISSFVTGRRTAWATILACLVALALAFLLLPRSPGPGSASALPASAESQRVATLLAKFPHPDSDYAIVVWSRVDGGRLSTADHAAIVSRITAVAPRSTSPATVRGDLAVNRTAILVDMPVDASASSRAAVGTRILNSARAGLPADLRAQLAGSVATPADASTDGGIDLTLVLISVIAALLLLVISRRPVLWLAQLVVLGAAGWLALHITDAVFDTLGAPQTTDARDLLFGIVVGLGTCYSLLLSARYLRARRSGAESRAAVGWVVAEAGSAIATNALLVAVGSLALLLATALPARAIGLTAAIGVLAVALLDLTLLPALLSVAARALTWPASPRVANAVTRARGRSTDTRSRAPVLVAIVTAAVVCLVVLDLVDAQLSSGIGTTSPSTTAAQKTIDGAFGTGYGNQAIMLVPSSLAGETSTVAPTTLAMNFGTVNSVIRKGTWNGRSELIVALDADPGSDLALATVRDIRASIAQTGGLTAATLVGGADAAEVDQVAAISADRTTILVAGIVAFIVLLLAMVGLLLSSLGGARETSRRRT
jgi:putative drug exporter of the RND superfamily